MFLCFKCQYNRRYIKWNSSAYKLMASLAIIDTNVFRFLPFLITLRLSAMINFYLNVFFQ